MRQKLAAALFSRSSHKLPVAAGLGVALAGAGRLVYNRRERGPEDDVAVSVITWNVLARPYTMYNANFHRNTHKVEAESQTRERYTMAGQTLLGRKSDLVFLQECEAAFFDPSWNLAASKVLAAYDVFPCWQEDSPGTVVLVKKEGRAVPSADKATCIGGTDETGGAEKSAAALPVQIGGKSVMAASVHFSWDGAEAKRLHHAGLIGKHLEATGGSVVFGGDFNTEPGDHLAKLEASSFLGKLQRAVLPEGTTTGLTGDFSCEVCIDHVYASKDLEVRKAVPLAVPGSPWGGQVTRPAKVRAASDHVPVLVELVWK